MFWMRLDHEESAAIYSTEFLLPSSVTTLLEVKGKKYETLRLSITDSQHGAIIAPV